MHVDHYQIVLPFLSNEQHALLHARQGRGQIDAGRGFSNATFLVGYCQNSCHVATLFLNAVLSLDTAPASSGCSPCLGSKRAASGTTDFQDMALCCHAGHMNLVNGTDLEAGRHLSDLGSRIQSFHGQELSRSGQKMAATVDKIRN